MKSKNLRLQIAAALVLGMSGSAVPAATLTFDEVASQPVDGLSVQGVTFHFINPVGSASDANYNVDLGLGATAALNDSVLEGDANGILVMEFATPVIQMSLGLGLFAGIDFAPGAMIEFYDAGNTLMDALQVPTTASPAFGLSEALVVWSGSEAKYAALYFDSAGGRFAVDNLNFAGVVPEPGTWAAGLAMGALGLGYWMRRRAGQASV